MKLGTLQGSPLVLVSNDSDIFTRVFLKVGYVDRQQRIVIMRSTDVGTVTARARLRMPG